MLVSASMKAAVLGSPISHSLSPALHNAAYAALGLDDWTYTAIECAEAGLPSLLASRDSGWAGLSLTMPLKRAVLPLLDRVDELAAVTGAANTVVFRGGVKIGYNTDVAGIVTALREAGDVAGPVTILGGGATACSALAAVREFGLAEVNVAVRDPARAAGLLAVADKLGVHVHLRAFGENGPGGQRTLISTLPAGAADGYAQAIRADPKIAPGMLLDVVYAPWPTPLAEAAADAGALVAGGFEMLLHQAAGQVALMTGLTAPVAAMRAGGQAELARRAAQPQDHPAEPRR